MKACLRAALGRTDGVPGFVAAIQTFGSGANFHPDVHAPVSAGLLLAGGEFVAGPTFDDAFERKVTERFRTLVLRALRKEERLSEEFAEKQLTFGHGGGFSVYGRHRVLNEEPTRLAQIARYVIRPSGAMDRVSTTADGPVLLARPEGHDGRDGAVVLDPLEWIRRLIGHLPDPGTHTVRYYGAGANRSRALYRPPADEGSSEKPVDGPAGEPRPSSRASRARRIRRVFECDPLNCVRCGAEMKIISFLSEPAVIDRIVRHLEEHPRDDPFDARAPPAA